MCTQSAYVQNNAKEASSHKSGQKSARFTLWLHTKFRQSGKSQHICEAIPTCTRNWTQWSKPAKRWEAMFYHRNGNGIRKESTEKVEETYVHNCTSAFLTMNTPNQKKGN